MGGACGLFNMLEKQCQGSDSGKSPNYILYVGSGRLSGWMGLKSGGWVGQMAR